MPVTARELLDQQFVQHRTQLLDVAAFLDRLDRVGASDFRAAALRRAVGILADGGGERTERIQMLLSDPRRDPTDTLDRHQACGAWDLGGPDSAP